MSCLIVKGSATRMHLHGHRFQMVALNDKRFVVALRDTMQVPSQEMVTVALDAGDAAYWVLLMPHLSIMIMTEFAMSA